MKKLFLVVIATLCALCSTHAQTFTHDFQKKFNYGTRELDYNIMNKTSDGGFVVVSAVSAEPGTNDQDELVIYKLNTAYDVIWQRKYDINPLDGKNFIATDVIEKTNRGFAICGYVASIAEGFGGFLLQIRPGGAIESFKFYPNDATATHSIIRVDRVLQHDNGFMMIGLAIDQTSQSRGIVIGAKPDGSILWSKHLFDMQHSVGGVANQNSSLSDIVAVKKGQYAVVGTANEHPSPDSDVLVAKINTDGVVLGEWVYERDGKVTGDLQPAYLDYGTTLVYNPLRNSLVIAGLSNTADEANCSVAHTRRLLTFEIDYFTGAVNWSKIHDFDPLQNPDHTLFVFDMVYNAKMNEYAIGGSRIDNSFSTTGFSDANGYVFRIDVNGNAKSARIYGEDTNDHFYSLNEGTTPGGYTACGSSTAETWVVESYRTITSTCNEVVISPVTEDYPLQSRFGFEYYLPVDYKEIEALTLFVGIKGNIICDKQGISIDPDLTDPYSKSATGSGGTSIVYPTIVTTNLNINNKDEFIQYTIYGINGSKMIETGSLNPHINRLDMNHFTEGFYILQLTKENGDSEAFKFILK